MTVEDKVIQMMRTMPDTPAATESEWRRFSTKAHRSLWGRRAALVGTAGMTAFVGTTYLNDPAAEPTTFVPADNNTDTTSDDREQEQAGPHKAKREPLILMIRGNDGNPEHVLRPSTVVLGRAKLDGGRLFYKVLSEDGTTLARGKIDPKPCDERGHCRHQYRTRIPFDVQRKQPGRLVVYIEDTKGNETAAVRIQVVLTPEG